MEVMDSVGGEMGRETRGKRGEKGRTRKRKTEEKEGLGEERGREK